MATVRFNLRMQVKKDEKPIYLVYRLDSDRARVKINTKLKVKKSEWNENTHRLKKNSNPFYQHDNTILDMWEVATKTVIKKNLSNGINPTVKQFKEQVIREMKADKHNKTNAFGDNFLSYFESFIKLKANAQISPNTIRTYDTALYHLKNYKVKKLNNSTIQLNDVDKRFMVEFNKYLFDVAGLMNNSVAKIGKNVRAVLNEAYLQGLIMTTSYKHKDAVISSVKQPKIFLSKEDIGNILDANLNNNERLERTRDKFIVQVYTGLRVEDLRTLDPSHIQDYKGRKVIVKLLDKTQATPTIPLKKLVVETLNKYDFQLPKLSPQKYNKYLKELCKIAKVNDIVVMDENKVQVNYKKYQKVTSHSLRRSYATNAVLDGVPINIVSQLMGHANVRETQRYICIDQKSSVDKALEYSVFD